jgi:hypothetical protein
MAPSDTPAKDEKKEPPKPPRDLLAEVDLESLRKKRAEAELKQKEATDSLNLGKARHFLGYWVSGGLMLIGAFLLPGFVSDDSRAGMFLISAAVVLWLVMWVVAFRPSLAVRRRQDQLAAANKRITELDLNIAFSHQVREEAKLAKVRKYAQAVVEKETS